MKDACVYEIELIFRYGVDFDRVATTRLIASGLSSFSLFLYVDQNRYTHIVVVVLLVGAISSKKPNILAYKSKNFGQIFALKVGGSTYTRVIKFFFCRSDELRTPK